MAALLEVETSAAEVSAEEMHRELSRLVGEDEVVAIEPIASLRSGESGAGTIETATYAAMGLLGLAPRPLRDGDSTPIRAELATASRDDGHADAGSAAPGGGVGLVGTLRDASVGTVRGAWQLLWDAVRLGLCGEDDPHVSRFVVLFRRRRVAALVVGMCRWPGELLSRPGTVRATPAPAPDDVYWPNLLRPVWRLRINWLVAIAATWALFLFWTIPVSAVQALTSVRQLSQNGSLSWLAAAFRNVGPGATSLVQGWLSASVLQIFLWLTLSSGLFEYLARLLGSRSESEVSSRALSRIFLFQLVLILLGSNIASPLFDSLVDIIEHPTLVPVKLANSLTSQSTFFLHYLLNGVLYGALFDMTQWLSLLALAARAVTVRCRGLDAASLPPTPPAESPQANRALFNRVYAKVVLLSGIWLTFFLVAPLTPLVALLYFAPNYYSHAFLLRHIVGTPALETGGGVLGRRHALSKLVLSRRAALTRRCPVLEEGDSWRSPRRRLPGLRDDPHRPAAS